MPVQDRVAPSPIAVSERAIVAMLPISVHYLRADRRKPNPTIPFSRIGDRIVYFPDRVREALLAAEVGGPARKRKT